MKLSVDSRLAQHWTFLLCDNEDDDEQKSNWLSLSLSIHSPNAVFLLFFYLFFFFFWHPMTLKDPDSPLSCRAASPPPGLDASRGSCGRTLAGTSGFTVFVRQKNLHERNTRSVSLSVCLSVWPIDHPTTIALPEIAVRDYLFGEPHLFFKWPYLSLKKWDTWGQWGRERFFFFFFVLFVF